MQKLNPHISVDCVVFGFDGLKIKVLLVYRSYRSYDNHGSIETDLKLPGDLISDEEDLDAAAQRILKNLTGLEDIYLEQFTVFGSPGRTNNKRDRDWLTETSGLPIERVVTIAYYSLIKIDEAKQELVKKNNAEWFVLSDISTLAFDHYEILLAARKRLREKLNTEPVGFELLPEKFTIRQLQNLYENISGRKYDNRNFRKKILSTGYLIPTNEKEVKVPHKPAQLFTFDKKSFKRWKAEVF